MTASAQRLGGERDGALRPQRERVEPAEQPLVGGAVLGGEARAVPPLDAEHPTPAAVGRRGDGEVTGNADQRGLGDRRAARQVDGADPPVARRRRPGAPDRGAPEAEVRRGPARTVPERQADDHLAGPAGVERRLDRAVGDVEQQQAAPPGRRRPGRGRHVVGQRGAAPAVAGEERRGGAGFERNGTRRPAPAAAVAGRDVREGAPARRREDEEAPPAPAASCQGAGPAGRGAPRARPVAPSSRVIVPSAPFAT